MKPEPKKESLEWLVKDAELTGMEISRLLERPYTAIRKILKDSNLKPKRQPPKTPQEVINRKKVLMMKGFTGAEVERMVPEIATPVVREMMGMVFVSKSQNPKAFMKIIEEVKPVIDWNLERPWRGV